MLGFIVNLLAIIGAFSILAVVAVLSTPRKLEQEEFYTVAYIDSEDSSNYIVKNLREGDVTVLTDPYDRKLIRRIKERDIDRAKKTSIHS